MNTIQKTKIYLMPISIALGFIVSTILVLLVSNAVGAANNCGVETAIIDCGNVSGKSGIEGSGVWSILLTAINILTAGIGIAAVAGLVYGSILYTSAGSNPEQVKKAIGIITNVVIGIIAYALMYSLLNFLIPGGLFT